MNLTLILSSLYSLSAPRDFRLLREPGGERFLPGRFHQPRGESPPAVGPAQGVVVVALVVVVDLVVVVLGVDAGGQGDQPGGGVGLVRLSLGPRR